MIEKIFYKKKLLGIIIRANYRNKKGVNFFTPNSTPLQIGYMQHKINHSVKAHLHKKILKKINYSAEVLILIDGKLRVDFFQKNKKYIFSKILKKNDIILTIQGIHSFKILKKSKILEVKQGPFNSKESKKIEIGTIKKIKIK